MITFSENQASVGRVNGMSHHESAAEGADKRLVDRMLFFSDAVFAIVLTLLALELRPPGVEVTDESALLHGLMRDGQALASFVISFSLGAAFWLAHLQTSRRLQRWDWPSAVVNLLHLLTVGLLPFAAALLGAHSESPVAFQGYCVVLILVSFTGALFWLTTTRRAGRFVGGMSWRLRLAGFVRTSAVGWAFIIGLITLDVFHRPDIARFSWLFIFPLIALGRMIGGREFKQQSARDS